MKNKHLQILTFLLFITSSLALNSQGLNTEFGYNEQYSQGVSAIFVTNEFTYLSIRESSPEYNTPNYLLKVDTNGIIIWKILINFQTSPPNEIINIKNIIESPDGGLIILANGRY